MSASGARPSPDPRANGRASRRAALSGIPPDLLAAVVAFLREWLPEPAKVVYRGMIEEDPDHWPRHPHFAGGVIAEHALRGNGITEDVLGVADLEVVWPGLVELALEEG